MPNAANTTQVTRGYAIAVISAVFLSTTAIFIRYLTQEFQLPALVLAFWRDVFVALTLVISLSLLRPALLRVQHRHLPYLLGYGLALACFNAFWTLSVALNGASVATVLVYCSAAFTALLGWWILREPLGWGKLLAVALSLGGCSLVAEALDPTIWRANLPGILTGIFAGLMYAVYSLMGRSAAQRGMNPWTTLLYTFAFAAGFLLLGNLLPGGPLPGSAKVPADFFWLGSHLTAWIVLLLLAAGPTVAGFGLYNVSLSYLPSSVANLIATMEPAFTAVIAYALFGERLKAVQIVGSIMIMGAVVFIRLYESWTTRQEARANKETTTAVFTD